MKDHRITALLVLVIALVGLNAWTLYYQHKTYQRAELAITAVYGDEDAREDAADKLFTDETEKLLGE